MYATGKSQVANNEASPDLGKPISIHRRRKLDWRHFGVVVLMGSFTTLAPLAYGLYRYYVGYTHHGLVASQAWSRPWYSVSLLGTFAFGVFTLYLFNRSRYYITIRNNGVHIHTNTTMSIPWSVICGLSHNTVQPNFLELNLQPISRAYLFLENGTRLQLDHKVENFDILLSLLKRAIYPQQSKKIQEYFISGKWVEFGAVEVHLSGIKYQSRLLPWRQIRRIRINSGFLMVELANLTHLRIPVIKIVNLELLLQLIHTDSDQ